MIKNFEKYWFIVLVLFFKMNVLGFFFYTESLEISYLLEFTHSEKAIKLESKQNLYDVLLNIILGLDAVIVLFLLYYGIKKSTE